MANYVLIHGAWHGSWVWERVKPLLEKLGNNVFSPTLKGLGERVNEATTEVSLSDHINDICYFLKSLNIKDIILVGHSYGGMVITGVANILPEVIAHLIYIDGIVPNVGQSVLDIFAEKSNAYQKVMTFIPAKTAQEFGLESTEDINWATPKYTPQPLKTFTEKFIFSPQQIARIKKTYIASTIRRFDLKGNVVFESFANTAKANNWSYFEIVAGHSCMLTAPEELVEVLIY